MPLSIEVIFNENPSGVYLSGERLSGKLIIATDRIKTIKGISVVIQGQSQTRWTEYVTRDRNGQTPIFTAYERHLNSHFLVMGSESGASFDLAAGHHEYPFQIDLPSRLPSSFIGEYGKIKYEIVCTIDRPWKLDTVLKKPFTVVCPLDLSLNPDYMEPIRKQTTKFFKKILFFGSSGPIMVKGFTPFKGYVPDQSIPLTIHIGSEANISIHETNACFVQFIVYRSDIPYERSIYESKVISQFCFGPLEKYQEREYSCDLYIPNVIPSSFNSSRVIEISYFVEIRLKTRGFHRNLKMKLPITIGTEPFDENQGLPSYEEALGLDSYFVNREEYIDDSEDRHR